MKKAKKRLLLSRAQRCHCGRVSSSLDRSITLSPSRHNQASSPKSSCLVAPRIENQIQCATVHENPKRDLDHFVACHNAPTMYSTPIRSFVLSVQLLLALSSIGRTSAFSIRQTNVDGRCSRSILSAKGGGRTPVQPDKIDPSEEWEADPTDPSECRLIICQVTDVYTLENFASFKTLVEETKRNSDGAKVISMLTGDFLSPYLLSSVDRGAGMMKALARIPLDYLTWGNHEADIAHKTVCKHVRNFPGTWLNSNMLDHEAMESQQEYDVIELVSPDGSHSRKVGLCAVLSDDPALYSHFKAPGAFGGATVTDPWEALAKYKKILEEEEGCDLVVPLQHLYVPDDHKTCKQFDFPVVLSGHDHHRVDEVVDGTRLLKPGMNAIYSTVLEISWGNKESDRPRIRARFVKNEDWEPDPVLHEENERAYDALIPLRNTELARVPSSFEPLSSGNARGEVCTMGKYICSLIKSAMNVKRRQRALDIDAVLLMVSAGNTSVLFSVSSSCCTASSLLASHLWFYSVVDVVAVFRGVIFEEMLRSIPRAHSFHSKHWKLKSNLMRQSE